MTLKKTAAIAVLTLLALAGGTREAQAQAPARTLLQADIVTLPLLVEGSRYEVVTHIYKPPGEGPFPLVIFSHGRAGSRAERLAMKTPFGPGSAAYWVRKGVAVVAPVRPGYGQTGGTDLENNFTKWSGGACIGNPDYAPVGIHARATVKATYDWALQQPWVRKDRILLEGQSVGGLTTVAAAALNLPGVLGAVNFAGGTGGNPADSPGKSCRPEMLTLVYGSYGQQARMPSIWFYAANDLYWGPDMPRTWFDAYRAGGSDTELVHTAAVEGDDGHHLLYKGMAMWRPQLDAFVDKVGLLKP